VAGSERGLREVGSKEVLYRLIDHELGSSLNRPLDLGGVEELDSVEGVNRNSFAVLVHLI